MFAAIRRASSLLGTLTATLVIARAKSRLSTTAQGLFFLRRTEEFQRAAAQIPLLH
jgi:hypothetical protein